MSGDSHNDPAPRRAVKPTVPQNLWLHRFAVLVSWSTLVLVTAGASVTSTGSGLAVPDWPLSFGTFFPPMVGGVIYEHGHRMIATTVGVLTIILVIWLFRKEERAWVRRLGLIALLVVVVQGLLGGVTVLLKLPTLVSVSHAGLAQIFFCLTVSIALFTSPGWKNAPPATDTDGASSIRGLALFTTGVVYVQILLGAFTRHMGAGLAIPDFPLAFGRLVPPFFTEGIAIHFAHRIGALIVSVCVVWLVVRLVRNYREDPAFLRPALLLAGLLAVQILLGALTIWTHRAVVPTTTHVAVGAMILVTALVLTLRSYSIVPVAMEKRHIQESPGTSPAR